MRLRGASSLAPQDALDVILLALIALMLVAVALYLVDALSIIVSWL